MIKINAYIYSLVILIVGMILFLGSVAFLHFIGMFLGIELMLLAPLPLILKGDEK